MLKVIGGKSKEILGFEGLENGFEVSFVIAFKRGWGVEALDTSLL
jgi:hypothetical protein